MFEVNAAILETEAPITLSSIVPEGEFEGAFLELMQQMDIPKFVDACNVRWVQAQRPESWLRLVRVHTFVFFSPAERALQQEIQRFQICLESPPLEEGRVPHPSITEKKVYSSLFSLARACAQEKTQQGAPRPVSSEGRETPYAPPIPPLPQHSSLIRPRAAYEREGGGQGKGGQSQGEGKQGGKQGKSPHAHVSGISTSEEKESSDIPTMNNIFDRFMALMARIIGQSEAEANDIYMRIKKRTDQLDLLTSALQKINSISGSIEAAKQPELMELLKSVREIGVEIPLTKTKWTEEEKRLLKENIQMRKESMEKVTQLERTDMQRYLQEISQCHQARSNLLKLMEKIMDTFVHNITPR